MDFRYQINGCDTDMFCAVSGKPIAPMEQFVSMEGFPGEYIAIRPEYIGMVRVEPTPQEIARRALAIRRVHHKHAVDGNPSANVTECEYYEELSRIGAA